MRKFLERLVIALAVAAMPLYAFGDYVIKDGFSINQTVKAFVCETTKICTSHVLMNSAGAEVGTVANPLQVSAVIIGSGFVNRSGTIAVGGTSQDLAAVNTARKRVLIQNPSSEIESLFINFTNPATTSGGDSIELVPGGVYDSDLGSSAEKITVNAATTGHKFIAKEM